MAHSKCERTFTTSAGTSYLALYHHRVKHHNLLSSWFKNIGEKKIKGPYITRLMKSLCSSGTCAGPLEDGEMKDGVPTPFACWFLLSSLCSLSWTSSSWFKYGIPSGETTSHSLTSGPVNEGAAVALKSPRCSDAMAPDVNTDWRSHPGVMGQKKGDNSHITVLTITEHFVEVKSLTGQEINTGTLKQQEKKKGIPFPS